MLDRLVAANPNSFEAYVLRAREERLNGRLNEALLAARRAWQLAPDDIATLLLAADLITSEQQVPAVETYFRAEEVESRLKAALARDPQDARIYHALARFDVTAGRASAAEERLRDGLRADPSNIDLHLLLADVLVGRRDLEGAAEEIAELERLAAPRATVEFLRARVAMAQSDWLTARRQLELAATATSGDVRFLTEVHLLLAACYRELGQAELEIATYQRALRIWAGSVEARIGLARALAEAGRTDEALSLYTEDVMQVAGVPADVARLRIRTNLQRPEAERDWSGLEPLLDDLARDPSGQVEAVVLRAELHAARGELEPARTLLTTALDRHRGHLELWLARADLELRAGKTRAAAAVIENAAQELGARPQLLVARIRLAAAGDADAARRELAALEERLDEFPGPEQFGILLQLALAFEDVSEDDSAMRNWLRAAEREPNNLAIRLRMLGLAIRTGAADEVAAILKEIRRIEGADGFYSTLSEAAHCMLRARQGERSLLIRARRLLEQADRMPAGSPARVQLAFAELCELEGDAESAVEHYRRAIELGERSPAVVERAVRVLYANQRYADAEALIEKYHQRNQPLAGELGRLAAEVSLRAHDHHRAIERARQAASPDSDDFQDQLWLARLLADAGQITAAETALRRARELGPARPEVWIESVRFAARHGRREQVPLLLEELAAQVPEEALPTALAQCYEAAGDLERAEEQHRRVLRDRPDHGPSLWEAATFYIRTGQAARAEPLLRSLLAGNLEDGSELVMPARRALAAVAASGGEYPALLEALDLLQQNLSAAPGSADDLLIKARLLATRPERRYRKEAVALFESLDARSRLALDDMRLLVRLHLELGDWGRARVLLQALLAAQPNDPDVLALALRAMIDKGETGDAAQQWLASLKAVEQPQSLRAAELEARLLIARGRIDEGVGVLRRLTSDGPADSPAALERQSDVARILAEISLRQERLGEATAAEMLAEEAERIYRTVLDRRSDEIPAFARFLARRWSADEALDLCEDAWGKLPAEQVAATCVDVLRGGGPDPEHFQRVIDRIAAAAYNAPDSAELQLHLANAAHLQGDYALAERSYRRALELAPGSLVARNELALLLALQRRDAVEALELINGAIEKAGPLPALLDTRATVYLAQGRPAAAASDLREAIEDSPTPVRHFHLAQALLAEKDNAGARTAFRQGTAVGLHEGSVHPLERSSYKQLQAEMQKL
jgi:tetratricopeptide (TPR) repeat protein